MKRSGYLYILFGALSLAVVLLLLLLYRLTPAEQIEPFALPQPEIPSDLHAVLSELSDSESWIFKMHLHQKQNIFTYPRTVYRINLN
jgi:hypothetical protein